jgi:hypothetical protein
MRLSWILCTAAATVYATLGTASASETGRMTGGGAFFCPDRGLQRVTHEFELNCGTGSDLEDPARPNKLAINLSGGAEFQLMRLRRGLCGAGKAPAPTQSFRGEGLGTFNGSDASITFTFTDGGEPGTQDTAEFEIKLASSGTTVMDCKPELPLILGRHRTHVPPDRPKGIPSAAPDAGGALYNPFAPSGRR